MERIARGGFLPDWKPLEGKAYFSASVFGRKADEHSVCLVRH